MYVCMYVCMYNSYVGGAWFGGRRHEVSLMLRKYQGRSMECKIKTTVGCGVKLVVLAEMVIEILRNKCSRKMRRLVFPKINTLKILAHSLFGPNIWLYCVCNNV